MGCCCFFLLFLFVVFCFCFFLSEYKTCKNENANNKDFATGLAHFPAVLEAGILIVELANSSQVLNTLSLPSSRLLSSRGRLIWGLKAVGAECQCSFCI